MSFSFLVCWLDSSKTCKTQHITGKQETNQLINQSTKAGFSLIEVIIALGVLSFIGFAGISVLIKGQEINRQSGEFLQASLYAEEGIEALKSIAQQDFSLLSVGSYGLESNSSSWSLAGANDSYQQFTRQLILESVERNTEGQIVESGGITDPHTYKATSRVNWDFSPLRSPSISYSSYITNWYTEIPTDDTCDWNSIGIVSKFDKVGNGQAYDVAYQNSYAYLISRDQAGSNQEFFVVDVSDIENPSLTASLNLNQTTRSLALSGNYAYLTTESNSEELLVIDISDPTNPTQIGSINLGSNDDANGVFVSGGYAYITKNAGNGSSRELYIVDISNPTVPIETGSLEVGADVFDVFVSNNYAYLGTASNTQELVVVDVSNPAAPTLVSSLDITSNTNAYAITYANEIVYLGRDNNSGPELIAIDVSLPENPFQLGTYEVGNAVTEINYSNNTIFISSGENNRELQILDVTDPENLNLIQEVDLGSIANGVGLDLSNCNIFTANESNFEELILLSINQAPPSPTPTASPIASPTSCLEVCQSQGYSTGTCRPNTNQCTNRGGTYSSLGDTFCTQGANADTCCCE